jgi:hypothetical protein
MKRIALFVLAPVLTSLALVMSFVSPASADVLNFWGNICWSATTQCMNQAGGIKGNFVQFWAHTKQGEPNNDWNVWRPDPATISWVSCSTGYPFGGKVSTATCNSWGINGDPVEKFAWAPRRTGSGYCIYSGNYDGSDDYNEYTSACSPTNSTAQPYLFVLTRYGFLMSVYATVFQQLQGGNNKRVYLGTCDFAGNSDANGESVCLTYNNGVGWGHANPP